MNNTKTGESMTYMNYNNINFVRQGWQCPICKRVLAPFIIECPYHNENNFELNVEMSVNSENVEQKKEKDR